MLLALASGTTISMAQLATTLYALALGVDSARLGIIAAMEPLGIALMTLPAGLLVARYGARRVYFAASMGPMLLNLVVPFTGAWPLIALTQALIGLCIPFGSYRSTVCSSHVSRRSASPVRAGIARRCRSERAWRGRGSQAG